MLVLTRKRGQQIVIGDDIVVTVLESSNGRVRLGISAAPEVPILREELVRGAESLPPALEFAECA